MKKPFMDDRFLLRTDTAATLYAYAAEMPIIDYHCHIDPRQIYENHVFEDLTQVWLGGDHYKWRAMRSNGVPERYITGKDTTPFEKFEQWAKTLPRLIGNPLYHWTHLELQRYFGIHEPLNEASCRRIWEEANEKLKSMTVRDIIARSRVETICTTDDPVDDLLWHSKLREDDTLFCQVLPAFRPDKALNIDKPGFADYISRLSRASDVTITNLETLKLALRKRLDFFVSMGCKAADHGLDYIMYSAEVNAGEVLEKVLNGQKVSNLEADTYKTQVMCFLAGLYRERGVVMQLHYGAVRNCNPVSFDALGPDTGYDAIWGKADSGVNLAGLLGRVEREGGLPKTIVYSLNPADNAQIGTIIGCFQNDEARGKIQHGSAWWFNDTKTGMLEQLISVANLSVLQNFVGMLTDSRSFLSYTRHEYFRRILCGLLGDWVENGEYPDDMEQLKQLVEDICYHNVKAYFGFK